MNYNNKYAQKFNNNMANTIKKWKGYEERFYNDTIIPICSKSSTLKDLIIGGKEKFPHMLWLAWVYKYEYPEIDDMYQLDTLWQYDGELHTIKIDGEKIPSVEKGKKFENILAERVNINPILQELAQELSGGLKHVGNKNKREDFALTEEFSIDIKYSDIQNNEKFKNIVKPFGNDWYSAIIKIQEGIIRSMYREGASQGQFRPMAAGQTKHHGIIKKTGNSYEEVTQEDYDKYNFGPLPSLRKNILYIYNDDGYWASFCLERVTEWASKHLEDLGFTDYTKDLNYKSRSPYEFWGFNKSDWKARQIWYGVDK